MLGEKPIKDGSQFEEESSETNEQTGIKTDQTDGKIERTDDASANFDESEELEVELGNNAKFEIESGNNSYGVDKLESIIEEEKENEDYPETAPEEARENFLSVFKGEDDGDDGDKNENSQDGFEGGAEIVKGDLKKRRQMTKKDVERKKEELVYLREGAVAQAVLFITRQYNDQNIHNINIFVN